MTHRPILILTVSIAAAVAAVWVAGVRAISSHHDYDAEQLAEEKQ